MREIIEFISLLHQNNSKEWFDVHRAQWKHIQTQFAAFGEGLIDGISSFDPSVKGLSVKDCTFRINRDIRFSNNKEPYKNHIGIYIAPHGKKAGYAGYYFHIEPKGNGLLGNSLLSAGLYMPEPVVLRSIRDEIFDNGAEIAKAISDAKGFVLVEENKLKRTPVGYAAGSEFDELLKLKDLYLEKRISEEFLLDDRLLTRTLAEFRKTMPLVTILNRAVQFAHEEMM
ncbi:MAG: DUF2461 domain-containing protein [Alistipes sp.]